MIYVLVGMVAARITDVSVQKILRTVHDFPVQYESSLQGACAES